MFGNKTKAVNSNLRKAMKVLGLEYEESEAGYIGFRVMGDDLPIGMAIMIDQSNMTLNLYCYVMVDIPEHAESKVLPMINTLNNTINNGGFYLSEDGDRIYFKIVQSFFDSVPSSKQIAHLITIALKTVDMHDGKLKDALPEGITIRKDVMYS